MRQDQDICGLRTKTRPRLLEIRTKTTPRHLGLEIERRSGKKVENEIRPRCMWVEDQKKTKAIGDQDHIGLEIEDKTEG